MLNLRDHVRLSNGQRLRAAQQPWSEPSPIGARERIASTVALLQGATPGTNRTEQTLYTLCQHRAGQLRRLVQAFDQKDPFAAHMRLYHNAKAQKEGTQ
jgi:hypothetical protein